jgi:hypothetical protein
MSSKCSLFICCNTLCKSDILGPELGSPHLQAWCRAQTKICQDIFLAIEKQGHTKVCLLRDLEKFVGTCVGG